MYFLRWSLAWLVSTVVAGAAAPPEQPASLTEAERTQGFRNGVVLAKVRVDAAAEAERAEAGEGLAVARRYARLAGLRALRITGSETADQTIARLRATGRYEYVERDYVRRRHALPNDPRFASGEQWYLRNTGADGGTAGADIRAEAAWAIRDNAAAIVVAVIDTGIRASHEDLAANLWVNSKEIPGNGRDDDGNGYVDDVHGINTLAVPGTPEGGNPDDDHGHGTHVAGLIGGVGNNAKGIAGVAWRVQIMALKFDDREGSASTSRLVECIDYAITQGANVINISYGGFLFSQTEYDALSRARERGIIVVVSAGNNSVSNDAYPEYPSNYLLDNIVAVAATDRGDGLSNFSNFGAGLVDLAAPGTAIMSTSHTADTAYTALDGTSFSAPLVAGAFAMLRAQFPGDSHRGLINRILGSVDPLPLLAGKVQSGGRLNLARALASTSSRPANDDFSARLRLDGPAVVIRSNSAGAASEANEPAHASLPPRSTLWWSWTAAYNGPVAVETTGSGFDTVLGIYTGTALNSLTSVAANDDVPGRPYSRAAFSAVAGTTYQIALGGKDGVSGPVVLTVGYVPTNDHLSDAIELQGPSVRVSGFNFMAGGDDSDPVPVAGAKHKTVWYKWTAPASTYYSFSLFAYGFDAIGGVYQRLNDGQFALFGAMSTEDYNEAAPVECVAGTTYLIQVDSINDATGYFDLVIFDGVALPGVLAANSSPALNPATNSIHVADGYGNLLAIPLRDIPLQWNLLAGTLEVQTPAMGPDGSTYIGDDYGFLYALDKNLGVRWRVDLGSAGASSSPALSADGAVYVHTDDGFLHAYFTEGNPKWRTTIPGESYSSPTLAEDGTIYIGSEDGYLYAVSPVDGSQVWRFRADGAIYASVALDAAGSLYFGTLNGKFYSITPQGELRWVRDLGAAISSSAAIGADGTVYFGSYDRGLYALTAAGESKWRYETGDEIRASSPSLANDGTIYIGSYDGLLHAVTAGGARLRTYATAGAIRSSPLLHEGILAVGSGDSRFYVAEPGNYPASSAWPMHRGNSRRTGRRLTVSRPLFVTQPASDAKALRVNVQGSDPLGLQWQLNGRPVSGATQSAYQPATVAAGQTGIYTLVATNTLGTATSQPAILGFTSPLKLVGPGTEFPNIFHVGTGFTYDQILLEGTAVSVTADPGQILRISFIDPDDDIVQVELSGAGTLNLVLEDASGPAAPAKYNQGVNYYKGRARITLSGADESTNLSVFSVGRANAANQALFRSDVTYGGRADIACIAITSTNGKFGGLRSANAIYSAASGYAGIYAPGVAFEGPLFVGDIRAESTGSPVLVTGAAADVRITGGNLLQTNSRAVQVAGFGSVRFTGGSDSHGNLASAQTNRARFETGGADVTNQISISP